MMIKSKKLISAAIFCVCYILFEYQASTWIEKDITEVSGATTKGSSACQDKNEKIWINEKNRDCSWVGTWKKGRCHGEAKIHCPVTCGMCDEMKTKDGEYLSTDEIDEEDDLSTKDYDDENNESGEEEEDDDNYDDDDNDTENNSESEFDDESTNDDQEDGGKDGNEQDMDQNANEENEEIPHWNETTWKHILDNYVPGQKVKVGKNETFLFRGKEEKIKARELIGEIREGGQLVVDLVNRTDHFFWHVTQTPLCNLLRSMAVIDTIPSAAHVSMPKRPLLNITLCWDCLQKKFSLGEGNWITAFYTTRIAAAAARVDVQIQCNDGRDSQMDMLLPWFETYQPAPTEENPWPFHGQLPTEFEACSDYYEPVRLDLMIDEIRNDMRKMGVTMFGSRENKSHPSVPLDQPPLVPDIEIEDVAIHLRCGDVMGGVARSDFGMMQFSEYKKWISKDARTVGIVTQPFEKERNRSLDHDKVDDCRAVTYKLVDYLQDFLPSAKISIHNSVNESLPMTYARLVMADQSFTTLSSFGIFPVIGGFGKGYFQKGNGGVNPFSKYLPEIYPGELIMMDAPVKTAAELRGMDLQSILDWFVEEDS
mmetsp:Transcript_18410/g.27604  ORF Transcript_18410/g.27604 Transcript_18410/m.27604 type:complete len:595 (-) Transcript_18410:896-2680(-)